MEEAKVNLSLKVGNNILTFRADTVPELESLILEGEASPTLSGAFFDEKPAAPVTAPRPAVLADDAPVSEEEALANVKEVLGATEEVEWASAALVKAAAAKSKKKVEELAGITKVAALQLIKEGK